MRKTIAVFVKNLTSGGAEKQSVLLAKAMTGECDVHYIIFNGKNIHQKYLEMLNENADIKIIAFHGGLLNRFWQFVKYVRKNHIDCIFSYLTAANLYACLAGLMTKAKTVTGLRNAELPWAKHIADRFLTNHLAVLTVCNCYSGHTHFCTNGFSEKKVEVIPNCFEHISPYKEKLEHEKVQVITVGRFVEQKDYETAIKAVKIASEHCPSLRFVIVGYGELEQQVRSWILQYGIDEITTVYINPDNITQLLDESDIYLSTSLFEGTSNSVMEGMNADLPIVCTNVGDNNQLVRDRYNGILTEKEDAESIASALRQLLCDAGLRSQMGEASKALLTENYSTRIFVQRYMLVINKVSN